jgi:aryl-alcohol dehydrogenase-like predicted oxidoreductase
MTILEQMFLGNSGLRISRLAMGCWAIGGHGWGKINDDDSVRAIKCAMDKGVTFYDTADAYGLGKSENLLAATLGKSRKNVVIATKGGVCWDESGKVWTDISPKHLRKALENSLSRLKIDHIPLYYIHKPDGVTPLKESVAALERLREEGKIGAIGLANFSPDQLVEALAVASIAAIQVRLNILDRDALRTLLPVCQKHGVTLVAWGALADGLLTGKFTSATTFGVDDHRSRMPAFMEKNFQKNIKRVQMLEQIAVKKKRKVSQLALRWILDSSNMTCSLFGAKTDLQVMENLGADGWRLSNEELDTIESFAI